MAKIKNIIESKKKKVIDNEIKIKNKNQKKR